MKEKPILFNTDMVKAILEGRKTQTRRIIKVNPKYGFIGHVIESTESKHDNTMAFGIGDFENLLDAQIKCHCKSPCEVGDILYVRETWQTGYDGIHENHVYLYKANGDDISTEFSNGKWKPSIHMPKDAARIFLKVKAVRVERLQDIKEEEARKEGTQLLSHDGEAIYTKDYKTAFKITWNKIYNNWKNNPWVWVIEFEKIDKRTI